MINPNPNTATNRNPLFKRKIELLETIKTGHDCHWSWWVFPQSTIQGRQHPEYNLTHEQYNAISEYIGNNDGNTDLVNFIKYFLIVCNAVMYNLIYINKNLYTIMGKTLADVSKFMAAVLGFYCCLYKNNSLYKFFELVFIIGYHNNGIPVDDNGVPIWDLNRSLNTQIEQMPTFPKKYELYFTIINRENITLSDLQMRIININSNPEYEKYLYCIYEFKNTINDKKFYFLFNYHHDKYLYGINAENSIICKKSVYNESRLVFEKDEIDKINKIKYNLKTSLLHEDDYYNYKCILFYNNLYIINY